MTKLDEIITLKARVEYLLKEFPETRNSDVLLTIKIWKMFYGAKDMMTLEHLYDLPSQDGIKRVRAYFQNTLRIYPPTIKEIALKRHWLESDWKIALGYNIQQELF